MDYKEVYVLKGRLKRIEREEKELYRIRHEMQKMSDKGSEADTRNLKLVQHDLAAAQEERDRINKQLNGR